MTFSTGVDPSHRNLKTKEMGKREESEDGNRTDSDGSIENSGSRYLWDVS